MNEVAAVRGAVKLNGERITGWQAFDVENNSYSNADSFNCTFVCSALPDDRNTAWFSAQQDMHVELFAGVPADPSNYSPGELTSWIYGQVDKVAHDPVHGLITVSGRDLTRLLIDAKTTEKWQNKTSSQIATILAKRHNLTPQVTATTTPVGKFYEIDHESMSDARTEWDMLTHLARLEQFDVRVRGQTLIFAPRADPTTAPPYPIVWTPPDAVTGFPTCNVEGLSLGRALTVSRGIIVTVRSWNDAAQKTFTAVYPTSKAKTITPGQSAPAGGAQNYTYNIPNLDQQKALQHAKSKYAEIIQHEMLCSFDVPGAGNDALDVDSIVQLKGTGTDWDQLYFPDSLRRSLSFDAGYQLSVNAKNHAPDSQEVTE